MNRISLVVLAWMGSWADGVCGQGTAKDYQRPAEVRPPSPELVARTAVEPLWIDDTRFWYEVALGPGRREFIYVEAENGVRRLAFDHEDIARQLSGFLRRQIAADALPIAYLEFDKRGRVVSMLAGDVHFTVDERGTVAREEVRIFPDLSSRLVHPDEGPRRSSRSTKKCVLRVENPLPDPVELLWIDFEGEAQSYGAVAGGASREIETFEGHVWALARKEKGTFARLVAELPSLEFSTTDPVRPKTPPREPGFDSPSRRSSLLVTREAVKLVDRKSGAAALVATDGTKDDAFRGPVTWSPDERTALLFREIPGDPQTVTLVESRPKNRLEPIVHQHHYAKPGDRLDVRRPVLLDIAERRVIPVTPLELFANAWSIESPIYDADGKAVSVLYNRRGHQTLSWIRIDARTGHARTLISEESPTFVDYAHKTWWHHSAEKRELLWMSERSGWNHLYRFDSESGELRNAITSGAWNVRRVEHIDPDRELIWFWAMGLREAEDPYHLHLCRVRFDGTGLLRLTDGDGTHEVQWSKDRRYFIDSWSRVDLAPVTELRSGEDGKLVCELERGDPTALLERGWTMPERFVAPGRDGQTPIFGIIVRPRIVDAAAKLPVVERVYAGPQDFHCPKEWSLLPAHQELAALGFVVVQADGMGTNWRGKAFHDVCAKNLADAGFPDRIAWTRAAARRRPEMDLSRVGIMGGSAGGQNAMRAPIAHSPFYDVPGADCGCHDNRMDKVWWNELWMGWPVGPHYAEQSNVTQAGQLQGRLFLIVGELDRNVDPASTMQVVDALIRADKDFDLLVVPGAGHGAGGTPYAHRRTLDYFVRHLHGREPRSP